MTPTSYIYTCASLAQVPPIKGFALWENFFSFEICCLHYILPMVIFWFLKIFLHNQSNDQNVIRRDEEISLFLLPKNGDIRWWAVFDHGQKFCKNNFVLDTILRSGLNSDGFLTSFNLSKKDLKFWPTNQIVRLHYLNLNFTCIFLNAEEVKKRWLF